MKISQSGTSSHFQITEADGLLKVSWPIDETNRAQFALSLTEPDQLIKTIGIQTGTASPKTILNDIAPVWQLFVGERKANKNGPYTFFDKVDERGYEEFPLELKIESINAKIQENRTQISLTKLTGRGFSGELRFTFFAHSPLIQLEAIVSTKEKNRAILYRSGLSSQPDQIVNLTYHQAGGSESIIPRDKVVDYKPAKQIELKQKQGLGRSGFDENHSPLIGRVEEGLLQARYRAVSLQTADGSIGLFPPPHKFIPPLDYAENVGFNFCWKRKGAIEAGIRQPPLGDGRYRPWVDCPTGSQQHLDLFLLISDPNS